MAINQIVIDYRQLSSNAQQAINQAISSSDSSFPCTLIKDMQASAMDGNIWIFASNREHVYQITMHWISGTKLLNMIRQNTLFPFLIKLRSVTKYVYLCVTGNIASDSQGKLVIDGKVRDGWQYASVQGAIRVAQEIGIVVLLNMRDEHIVQEIRHIAEAERDAKRVKPIRDGLFLSPPEDCLQSIPGIGEVLCHQLLDYYGSVAYVLEHLSMPESSDTSLSSSRSKRKKGKQETRQSSAPTISKTLQKNVRDVLGLDDKLCLRVVPVQTNIQERFADLESDITALSDDIATYVRDFADIGADLPGKDRYAKLVDTLIESLSKMKQIICGKE